jgi:hypothetical protein
MPLVPVAFNKVPAVDEQEVAEVSKVAFAQRSLAGAGGSVMQILKAPFVLGARLAPVEYTRT